jgi:hypothetical protein|tara:strand:- start:416 stop:742 length:327 start_codon:yes stop_codon:yes gene_type:complete
VVVEEELEDTHRVLVLAEQEGRVGLCLKVTGVLVTRLVMQEQMGLAEMAVVGALQVEVLGMVVMEEFPPVVVVVLAMELGIQTDLEGMEQEAKSEYGGLHNESTCYRK